MMEWWRLVNVYMEQQIIKWINISTVQHIIRVKYKEPKI